jgi:uncharacterized membrane protein YczE
MRLLIALSLGAGLVLLAAGAAAPGRFVLALLGLVLLAVGAALSLAPVERPHPRARP